MKRNFNRKQKIALYLFANGKCSICGKELTKGWHADHIKPFCKNGKTDVINGQALCPECNRKKGVKMIEYRKFQKELLIKYQEKNQKDFLLMALPGAGKTVGSLMIAEYLLNNDITEKIIVVVPTENLKYQWEKESLRDFGLNLDPEFKDVLSKNFNGIITTYQAVYFNYMIFQKLCREYKIFVILDEIHHCGDRSKWGESIKEAFKDSNRRLTMTGTPFRGDNTRIPFVTYYDSICSPDFSYDYPRAIREKVIRLIDFKFYDGEFTWLDDNDNKKTHTFEDELNQEDYRALKKTALDPNKSYIQSILMKANDKLDEIRKEENFNAGGMIIAKNIFHAEQLKKILEKLVNEEVVKVTADEKNASKLIKQFDNSSKKWIISIKKVSEGVNIKRLRVLVWATNVETELYFRQVNGRIIRFMNQEDNISYSYLPNLLILREYADKITKLQLVAIEEEEEENEKIQRELFEKNKKEITPLNTTEAQLKHNSFDGESFSSIEIESVRIKAESYGVNPIIFLKILKDNNNLNIITNEIKKEETGMTENDEIKELRNACNSKAYALSKKLKYEVKEIHNAWIQAGGKLQKEKNKEDLIDKIKWLNKKLKGQKYEYKREWENY